jgi:hypothetical protein
MECFHHRRSFMLLLLQPRVHHQRMTSLWHTLLQPLLLL